jgi:hypothetical protein
MPLFEKNLEQNGMSIAEIGPLLLEWNIAQTFLFLFVLKQNSDATFTAKCVSTVILILKKVIHTQEKWISKHIVDSSMNVLNTTALRLE